MSKVIAALNGLMVWELTSIDQYTRDAELFDDWGLTKLGERLAHEADDERRHAKMLTERIIFLGGKPDMETRHPLPATDNVAQMLQAGLELEHHNARDLKAAIKLCETEGDFVSRNMLVEILRDTEEDHAYWLRQQLGLIEQLGLANYLQSQV